jgi:hypothetical protein
MQPITQRRWFVPAALLLVMLIYFRHVIFMAGGMGFTGSDFRQQVYPFMNFIFGTLRDESSVPLWNPHQFLGYSVLGNPQSILFYFPNWILVVFPGTAIFRGVGLVIAIHAFWSSWGMANLARAWGSHPVPALLAGIIFAYGGFPAARIFAGHYTLILAMAWVPWVLFTFRQAAQTGGRRWVVWGGLALAMQIFAGHPQITYLTGIGLVMQWVFEMIDPRYRARITRHLALLIVLGAILSAVSWLPIYDYNEKTVRGADNNSLEFVNEFAIPSIQLSTLAVPDLFGNPLDPAEHYFGRDYFEEMTIYIGLLPLLLLALVPVIDRNEGWFFAAMAAIAVLMSIGLDGGVQAALYRWSPLADGFRSAGRAMILLMIGLCNLMALTLTHLMDASLEDRRHILKTLVRRVIPVLLLMLFGVALVYAAFDDSPRGGYRSEQLMVAGIFLAITGFALWLWTLDRDRRWILTFTVAILVLDVWRVSWVIVEPRPLTMEHLWQEASIDVPIGAEAEYGRVIQLFPPQATPNGASWTGHQSSQGYDPLAPSDWVHLYTGTEELSPASPIPRLMGVRYAMSAIPLEEYSYTDVEDFELIGLRAPYVFYENTDALPRAYIAEHVEVVADDERARERLRNGEHDFLDREAGCEISGEGGSATITNYTPNQVTIRAQSNGTGLLILSDQYDDDWRATVNGQSADIIRANTAMRAVCVPEGESEVIFSYAPQSLVYGALISGIGWGFLLLWGVASATRNFRKPHEKHFDI